MHPASDTHRVVAIDMGYGHLRPAHALADALGSEVLHADRPPLASTRDQQQWDYVRRYYEAISRASRWPLLGAPMALGLLALTCVGLFFYEQAFVRAGQLPPLS